MQEGNIEEIIQKINPSMCGKNNDVIFKKKKKIKKTRITDHSTIKEKKKTKKKER